jgi:integrase/recombinase XerD
VRTKKSKALLTTFFPVGGSALQITIDWIDFLTKDRLWGLDNPVFPATLVQQSASREFFAAGLSRHHWKNATPIRRIFKDALEAAGLPSFNPHSFRHALAVLGERMCKTPEEFKAWSQNLGHDRVMTTLTSYGQIQETRQSC